MIDQHSTYSIDANLNTRDIPGSQIKNLKFKDKGKKKMNFYPTDNHH